MQKRYIEIMCQTASPQPSLTEREKGCALTALRAPSPWERVGVRLFLLLLLLLTGCTKGDVYHPTVADGYVIIHPQNGGATLPALRYHFYCTQEGHPAFGDEPLRLSCDGKGNYEGALSASTYCVLATNAHTAGSVKHVIPSDLNDVMLATVRTEPLPVSAASRAEEGTLLSSPGSVYAVSLNEVVSHAVDTLQYTPPSRLLTKCIQFTFVLNDGLENSVSGLEGVLHEVYPSVRLFSGEVADPEINPITGSMGFETTRSTSNATYRNGEVYVFGVRDPLSGEAYTNRLDLTVTFSDGSRQQLKADITEELSRIFSETGGNLPLMTSIPIGINVVPSGLEAKVLPWNESGTGEGTV